MAITQVLAEQSFSTVTASEERSKPLPTHPIVIKPAATASETIATKNQQERIKRLRADGVDQFRATDGELSKFQEDRWSARLKRPPIHAEKRVLVVGGGFGGLVTGVNLRKEGIDDFLIVEKGSDFGGTWYWNQYPGVTCDVESLIYLPFLEETGYIPKDRFSYGPEIREHVERIVCKWDLRSKACLQTQITSITWDNAILRWHIRTDRSDHIISQFVVLATGTLHKPKLPALRGIENFKPDHFHSGRFDYEVTGGDADSSLPKLKDKVVGIIGTGASGVQLVPRIARDSKKLYVFQRTPSTVTPRENWKNDLKMADRLKPGWQADQMDLFANIMQGESIDRKCTALEGLEALTMMTLKSNAEAAGIAFEPENIPDLYKAADFMLMKKLRRHVEDTVLNKETAEKLKPWYNFMCKRPAFHDEYYAAFNLPNVELIDTDGKGVSHLTSTGVVVNEHEYAVDLLIYSTGFEFEIGSDFQRRTDIHLFGSSGQTLDQKFALNSPPGPSTVFGIHTRGFPNLFMIGPAQAGVTANQTHTICLAAQHIASVIKMMFVKNDIQTIEPTAEAEESWSKQIEQGSAMRLAFHEQCPPGYYNAEGKPERIPLRWGAYPKGIVTWGTELKAWRDEGRMAGMETGYLRTT